MSEKEKHSLFRQKKVKNQYVEGLLRGLHKGAEIGGGSGGEVVLEELTVTKNGIYTPSPKFFTDGASYQFKEIIESETLEKICGEQPVESYWELFNEATGNWSWQKIIIAPIDGKLVLLLEIDTDYGSRQYCYTTPENISILEQYLGLDQGVIQPYGWYELMMSSGQVVLATAPILEIPEGAYYDFPDELIELFKTADGYNKVIVDVTAGGSASKNLTDLTITKSGTYSRTPTSLERRKLYTFKADLTDIDFEELATYGQELGDNQYMLYTNGNSAIGLSLENEEYKLLFMAGSAFFSYTKSNGWLVEENEFGDVNKPVWRPYGSIAFDPIMEESLEATSNTGWEYLLPLFEQVIPGVEYYFRKDISFMDLMYVIGEATINNFDLNFIQSDDNHRNEYDNNTIHYVWMPYVYDTPWLVIGGSVVYVSEWLTQLNQGYDSYQGYDLPRFGTKWDANQSIPVEDIPLKMLGFENEYINPAILYLLEPVDGFDTITADVHEAPELQTLNVTQNGTYTPNGFDGYNEVTVDVPQSILEVNSEEEMEELFTNSRSGIVVRYLGEEGTYKTGALYLLEEEET